MNIKQIIRETIHKALLKEYFDAKPQRLPFDDDFYKDEHIYDYINWLKQAGKIGKLPKPKITWDEGLKKGCIEYVKKYGAPHSRYNLKDLEKYNLTSKVIYKLYKEVKARLNPVVVFDDNGNLYVERAIRLKRNTNYYQLINDYQNNPGGCWALNVGTARAYCGHGEGDQIVLHGYMCLDDIFWGELVRKTLGEYKDEWEVRTFPNGKVEITSLHVNGDYLDLQNEPVIINSTYLGNNAKFKGDHAPLGYKSIGYEYNFIDRQGNIIENTSKLLTQEFYNYKKTGKLNNKYDEVITHETQDPSLFVIEFHKKVLNGEVYYNILNTKTSQLLFPDKWFEYIEKDLYLSKLFLIRDRYRYNLVDENCNLIWKKDEQWLDAIDDTKDTDYVRITLDNKDNFMDVNGNILWEPDNIENWFESATCFEGKEYACVKYYYNYQLVSNYITKQGEFYIKEPIMGEWPISCYPIQDGYGVVEFKDNMWNFIKEEDKEMLFPSNIKAKFVFPISCGVAPICQKKAFSNYQFINTKGEIMYSDIYFDKIGNDGSFWTAHDPISNEWYMVTDKEMKPFDVQLD